LIKLGNFPPLKRLHTMLLTNNRISRIAEDCFDPLPNVISITLTGNKLEKLVDLEPLTRLKNLARLSLLENPVTKVKHYRPYMINKCQKNLRILDFNRIKEKERKASGLLFAGERGRKLLEEIAPPRSAADKDPSAAKPAEARTGPSPEVIEKIKKAIAEAETIEEVTRLEKALKSGVLPEDLVPQGPEKKPEEAAKPEEKPAEEKPESDAKRAKTDAPEEKKAEEKPKEGEKEAEKKGDAVAVDEEEDEDLE